MLSRQRLKIHKDIYYFILCLPDLISEFSQRFLHCVATTSCQTGPWRELHNPRGIWEEGDVQRFFPSQPPWQVPACLWVHGRSISWRELSSLWSRLRRASFSWSPWNSWSHDYGVAVRPLFLSTKQAVSFWRCEMPFWLFYYNGISSGRICQVQPDCRNHGASARIQHAFRSRRDRDSSSEASHPALQSSSHSSGFGHQKEIVAINYQVDTGQL